MPAADTPATPTLKRAITGSMLTLFILGDVLGAGVYALAGAIAGEVGRAVWVALLVALGFALLTAGSYAELVTKYPHAGASARRRYLRPGRTNRRWCRFWWAFACWRRR